MEFTDIDTAIELKEDDIFTFNEVVLPVNMPQFE